MTTLFKYVQAQNFALAGAGAIAGATSIILKEFKAIDGTTDLTMTDFGAIGFATIEPGNGTQEEQISFTGVTQNANGTATLTGVSTVLFIEPYTATSGLALTHPGSATLVISNTAGFYNKFGAKANDETLTGYWLAPDPISAQGIATRAWVLSVVNGGAVSFDQMIEGGIAGEVLVAGDLIYFSETDNEWLKTDADTLATVMNVKLGISQGAGVDGGTIAGGVLTRGTYTTAGLTQGDLCYASNTAGGINSGTAGTVPRVIGVAKDATTLYFDPDFQNTLYDYAVDSVGSDTYAVTLPGALSKPFVGAQIAVKFGTANTGASTLNVNGSGAVAIVKATSTALETNDILANMIGVLRYNGTGWQLLNPRVIDGATQITGIVPIANLALTAYQQAIAAPIQGSASAQASGSNTTGSVIYAVHDNATELYRYERDSVSGVYFQTHSVNMTAVIPAGDYGTIIEIGVYIYVFYNDGVNIIVTRFLAADLTGAQAMTVPTVTTTGQVTAWTDGTFAYVTDTTDDTTLHKWSISGTVMTEDSTSAITGNIFAESNMATMFDGTTVYVIRRNSATISIYKLATALAASYTTTTKTIAAISDLDGVCYVVNIDASRMYIGKTSVEYDEAAQISSMINLFPITKP